MAISPSTKYMKYIRRVVNLDGGPLSETLPPTFFNNEYNAHTFLIELRREGKRLNITYSSPENVTGRFLNANDQTVIISSGEYIYSEADDITAIAISLPHGCYDVEGRFTLTLSFNSAVVYKCQGYIERRSSDNGYDPDGEIGNLDELVARINEMRAATTLAQNAAAAATTVAENVDIDLTEGTDSATITITRPDGTKKTQTINVTTDDASTDLIYDERLLNNGQYVVTASDMESGTWAFSDKKPNTKRLRNRNLIPVSAGMQIAYSNPTLKVAFGVLPNKTSGAYSQPGSWIAPGGSGVVNIIKNGYLAFLCESASNSAITVSDYDCNIIINTEQTEEAEKVLTTTPVLGNLSGLYGLPYNPVYDFSLSDEAGNVLFGFKDGTLYVPNIANSNLVGKKISIIGDSISTYSGYIPDGYATYYPRSGNDIDSVEKTWWKQLINETGLVLLKNASWSGSGVCGNSASTTGAIACSDKRIADIAGEHGEHPDLILIYISTNDWGLNNREIGTFTSQSEIPSDGTITKITEAYALMLYKLRTTYPLAKIFCILNLEGRLTENDTQYPIVNTRGETIHEVNHAISEVAHIFGAKTIDLETSGITFWNVSSYTGDGTLHPNAAGAIIIKNTVKKALLSAF